MNKYLINTLQDILNCITEKNIDKFLVDFETWLRTAVNLEIICKEKLQSEGFLWIDDDKNEGNFILSPAIIEKLNKVKNEKD